MRTPDSDGRRAASRVIAGSILTLALVLGTAALSSRPEWQSMPEGTALLRLSFAYSGVRNCRDRTPEELAALARNMRQKQICERRRLPVEVVMQIDGAPAFQALMQPSGLSGSGPSRIYRRFVVPAGQHRVSVALRADPAVSGFTHEASFDMDLSAGESAAIDFSSTAGNFVLR